VLTDTDPTAQVALIGEGDNVPYVLLNASNNVVALSVRMPQKNRIAMHLAVDGSSTGRERQGVAAD